MVEFNALDLVIWPYIRRTNSLLDALLLLLSVILQRHGYRGAKSKLKKNWSE